LIFFLSRLTADGVRTSSETIESEKQEKNEKKHHQQQEEEQVIEKPMEPPSPKSEKPPKNCFRRWFCCSCLSSSPCY